MINEDDNPSWPFLIDLDLAINESRETVSGVKGKTGMQVFKAIGALLGELHSFMHSTDSVIGLIGLCLIIVAYIKLLISKITCERIQLSRKALGQRLEMYRSGSG